MKNVRFLCFAVVLLTIVQAAYAASPNAGVKVLLNTLREATPDTTFSAFGTSGPAILPNQWVGPKLVLKQPTLITEIGAFVNNCAKIVGGDPQCPDTNPFLVQIHKASDGTPLADVPIAHMSVTAGGDSLVRALWQPDMFLARPGTVPSTEGAVEIVMLSHDDDPLTISFERSTKKFVLPAGEYYLLIRPLRMDGSEGGFLLGSTFGKNPYTALQIPLGFLNFFTKEVKTEVHHAAIRIVGKSLGPARDNQLGPNRNKP